MTTIGEFSRARGGGSFLILGNGPSCRMFDLARAKTPVIGLNQAWRVRPCEFNAMGDPGQYEMFERDIVIMPPRSHITERLFTTETGPQYAVRLQGLHNDPEHPKRFSLDLTEGVYLNNTIASFGFQLAVWMLGESGTIYTLGIDSDGPQFDGSPMPPGTWENQRETLGYIAGFLAAARPGIKIYDLSPVSKQRVFERRKFEEVFG